MATPHAWDTFMASTGYDRRKTQDELVELINSTLNDNGHLLARAGTGTGKSLAAVIPSLAYARTRASAQRSGPVIVSTATKALQGQYSLKDLPFMEKHFTDPSTNAPGFEHAILKGKKNYLCLDKFENPSGRVAPEHRTRLELSMQNPDWFGDMALVNPSLPKVEEAALTMSAGECPGKRDCAAHLASIEAGKGGCYYERAKANAAKSDVMVINHALLAAHLKIAAVTKGNVMILPAASVYVLDEVHKFPGYVQGALGWFLTVNRLLRWANNCIDDHNENDEFKRLCRNFFSSIPYDTNDKKNAQQITTTKFLLESPELHQMRDMIESVAEDWQHTAQAAEGKERTEALKRAQSSKNLRADIELATYATGDDHFWTELDKQQNKILNCKPSEDKVARFLRDNFWDDNPAILLSATTPAPKKLGLPRDVPQFDADSPFDFKNNSRLYISKLDGSAPFDKHERLLWEQRRHAEMLNLVAASDGRALLLFTSWVDLNKAYEALAPRIQAAGHTTLRQEKDNEGERDRLAAIFKQDEHSVLFGTESFFEGVDVPGRSCQLVIISKMPFPAMIDNTRGGKLDFREQMLPEMRMKIVQAAGRLIRTHSDKGLVAIMDSRMMSKPYGKNILANVSPFNEMTYVRTLKEAMDYLEELEN